MHGRVSTNWRLDSYFLFRFGLHKDRAACICSAVRRPVCSDPHRKAIDQGELMPDKGGNHATDLLHCPVCAHAFEFPPRNGGGDVAVDLSFSHIPKVLAGCLHTMCQSCAEEALQRSDDPLVVPCPLCGIATTGVSNTNGLTNNILALQDVQRRSGHCDLCDDTIDASHRCLECESLLCSFHVKAHTRSRGTKSHHVLSLGYKGIGDAATRIARRIPLFCPRHVEVPAKLFCSEPCGILMCNDCSVADHSGHRIFLADSDEVEVIHRTALTRHVVNLGHRLATVQGAVEAVQSVKTGVERSTRMAEKAAMQAFSNLRRAVDSREKNMLKNLRGARASKTQELNAQLERLEHVVSAYTSALALTGDCLDRLKGDQLLAMEPDLRKFFETNEADFSTLTCDPCVDDRVEFAYDRDVANALRLGISKVGCLASISTEFQDAQDKTKNAPEEGVHQATRDIHFTLAAIVGASPENVAATPSDTVVVEIRNGSEKEFLRTGIEGAVIGRVVLHTKIQGVKYLTYESENFFESLSQRVLSERQKAPSDRIPTVRFTKNLRISGRRAQGPKL